MESDLLHSLNRLVKLFGSSQKWSRMCEFWLFCLMVSSSAVKECILCLNFSFYYFHSSCSLTSLLLIYLMLSSYSSTSYLIYLYSSSVLLRFCSSSLNAWLSLLRIFSSINVFLISYIELLNSCWNGQFENIFLEDKNMGQWAIRLSPNLCHQHIFFSSFSILLKLSTTKVFSFFRVSAIFSSQALSLYLMINRRLVTYCVSSSTSELECFLLGVK